MLEIKITKDEYHKLIKILEDKLKSNPYDKEVNDMIENLKKKQSLIPEESEREETTELINVFYEMGIYSSKKPEQISEKEKENSIDFMVLAKKYKKPTKNFMKPLKNCLLLTLMNWRLY